MFKYLFLYLFTFASQYNDICLNNFNFEKINDTQKYEQYLALPSGFSYFSHKPDQVGKKSNYAERGPLSDGYIVRKGDEFYKISLRNLGEWRRFKNNRCFKGMDEYLYARMYINNRYYPLGLRLSGFLQQEHDHWRVSWMKKEQPKDVCTQDIKAPFHMNKIKNTILPVANIEKLPLSILINEVVSRRIAGIESFQYSMGDILKDLSVKKKSTLTEKLTKKLNFLLEQGDKTSKLMASFETQLKAVTYCEKYNSYLSKENKERIREAKSWYMNQINSFQNRKTLHRAAHPSHFTPAKK